MNRQLVIQYFNNGASVHFRIIKQTHRGTDFAKDGSENSYCFNYGVTTYKLHSSGYPQVQLHDHAIAVWGSSPNKDDTILRINSDAFYGWVLPMIVAYNDKYSRNTIDAYDVAIEVKHLFDLKERRNDA